MQRIYLHLLKLTVIDMFNFLAVGRVGVQPGGDFRQERSALHRPGSTLDRAELPSHRYPQGNEPGRKAVEIPAVQRFPEGKKYNSLPHSKQIFVQRNCC